MEFLYVAVPILNFGEYFGAMRTSDDAFVRELRVVFERSLAEKMRSVAFSAEKAAMRLFVLDQLFFRLEHRLALLARKFRQALMCMWCCIFEGNTRPQFLHFVGIGA